MPLTIGQRDLAKLLHAAALAAESLETRAETAGVTMTLATDEVAEIAEQMGRIVALMTAMHISQADPRAQARRPEAA